MKAFLFACMVFILSCNQADDKVTGTEPGSTDSVFREAPEKIIYIERASLDLPRYSIRVKTRFFSPETISARDSSYYFDANMLFVLDKQKRVTDSLQLDMDYQDGADGLAILDLSDSLRFKTLLLYITWTGSSDLATGAFVERTKDTIRNLFTIYDLQNIERKDSKTLSGFVRDRDELVSAFQSDYPFIVSLKDYAVQVIKPAKQYIGHPSEALAPIQAYIIKGPGDSSLYTIKTGTQLLVDTMYRSTNSVRLIVSDSITVHASMDKLEEKLQGDTAG